MGFMANWFGEKSTATRGLMPLSPSLRHDPVSDPDDTHALESALSLQRALDALGRFALARGGDHPTIRDFTTRPTIDPSELSKIMPRDGECALAVSGLDGVLTIGKDMSMTTDQPIHCQTIRVLGTLEATVHAHKIIIVEGASVVGSVRVNDAEIYGDFNGSLQVRNALTVFATATLSGKIRATEISLAKQAKVSAADIKRVVPKILDGVESSSMSDARFEDGYSSMSITVSQRSAIRV